MPHKKKKKKRRRKKDLCRGQATRNIHYGIRVVLLVPRYGQLPARRSAVDE